MTDTPDLAALMPCPFCGDPAFIYLPQKWVSCSDDTCPASLIKATRAAWNTRAGDLIPRAEVEAIRSAALEALEGITEKYEMIVIYGDGEPISMEDADLVKARTTIRALKTETPDDQ